MDNIKDYFDKISEFVILYGTRVLLALVVLIIGLALIKRLNKGVGKALDIRGIDPSLKPFLKSVIGSLLKVVLFISIASMLGIEMTSFIAILGAAGLAVGLALQGSLSNFAGGILILLLKPFKVGDFIEGAGHSGTVREIQVFYTYLTTPNNQEIIIPNGQLSNNSVKNYSFHSTRRVDLTFGIGYGDSIDKAKGILERLIKENDKILTDPAHDIFIESLADSSVNFHVRCWSSNEYYWDIVNGFPEKVKKAFDAEGVSIPFPQRDIHVHNISS